MTSMQGVPLLFAASLVYVIASSINCDNKNSCKGTDAYAVSVGMVSLGITSLLIGLRVVSKEDMLEGKHKFLATFLFLWWGVGAAVGTFDGPFTVVSNGYFSAWAGFLFATQYAYASSDVVRNVLDRGASAMGPKDDQAATVG
ncbi:hypothetical protein JKP88DRAFT_226625 [Tribonema minus]|uniref:Uncharacterized protein n=1 Tax=Tribonema minus TaxID=303371 RepID=A0A836C9Z2_9STRA|nr:hypothetical protein JKP88DRAFT_226625 [Tribonema minus]|eukprot:TRINITY_DN340_c0_g2_i1.p2 TRINITY_DN340_c0_g2~~TRINITY_DN340_c0_g2_i1.p2  ORF type:complete len:143 (-),score=55.96 TRINITY_DN340_c0_g2_i1:750-1178(-)